MANPGLVNAAFALNRADMLCYGFSRATTLRSMRERLHLYRSHLDSAENNDAEGLESGGIERATPYKNGTATNPRCM